MIPYLQYLLHLNCVYLNKEYANLLLSMHFPPQNYAFFNDKQKKWKFEIKMKKVLWIQKMHHRATRKREVTRLCHYANKIQSCPNVQVSNYLIIFL